MSKTSGIMEVFEEGWQQSMFLHNEDVENFQFNLVYPIHPVFQRDNWALTDDTLWNSLEPVLRLASALLESPASLAFVYSLVFSPREVLEEDSARYKKVYRRFHQLNEDEQTVRAKINLLLIQLGRVIRLGFFVPNEKQHEMVQAYVRPDDSKPISLGYGTEGYTPVVSVNMQYYRHLQEAQNSTEPWKVCRTLRFQFIWASILCHEVIHAIHKAIEPDLDKREPFYEDDRLAELGFAWESVVLGGTPNNYNFKADLPLNVVKWSSFNCHATRLSPERRGPKRSQTTYFIPMTWIADLHRQGFWNTLNGDASKLRIPKRVGYRQYYRGADFDPEWNREDSSEGRYPADEDGMVWSPNWLLDPRDQEVAVAAFKRVRQVFVTKAMAPVLIGAEAFPGTNVTTDAQILDIIKQSASTVYHAAATCAMGQTTDPNAVVDSQARVIGVTGLRVVDASAFPFLPPGHPQATGYALAEKIADKILNPERIDSLGY